MNAAKDCTLQEKLLRCAMALILAAGALLASVAASPAYAAPSTVDVSIGGKTRFVCVDGPDFDGHQVDWDNMLKRMRAYRPAKDAARARERDHACRLQAAAAALAAGKEAH